MIVLQKLKDVLINEANNLFSTRRFHYLLILLGIDLPIEATVAVILGFQR